MFRKIMIVALSLVFTAALIACTPEGGQQTADLTSITWEGANDQVLPFETSFNVKANVRARGNDGNYYDSYITYTSVSSITADMLNTSNAGIHSIRYTVSIPREGTTNLVSEKWRYITVENPVAPPGQLIVNGDFSQGMVGWDHLDQMEGGVIQLSTGTDGLTAVVTAGTVPWSPRVTQMNIPFEMGKTYIITYEAKSSVARPINLQTGHILANDPWFTDFDHKEVVHNLTTDWAQYSWFFTHNIENVQGGILFELGAVSGQRIDATINIRNVNIVEQGAGGEDTLAPDLTGVPAVLTVPATVQFNPLQGVFAVDNVDGDITADIEVEIRNASNQVVGSVDTSVAGTYTVKYTVADAANNVTTKSTTVTVEAMNFGANLLGAQADFSSSPLGVDTNWDLYLADWQGYPGQGALAYDAAAQALKVTVSQVGETGYAVKFMHKNTELEQGATYLLEFTWRGSVARNGTLAIGFNDPTDPGIYYSYAPLKTFQIGTTSTYTFYLFTVEAGTDNRVEIGFELGQMTGSAIGNFFLESISLRKVT